MKKTTMMAIVVVAMAVLVVGGLTLRDGLRSPGMPQRPGSRYPPVGGPMPGPGVPAEFEKSHRYALQLAKLAMNIERLKESGKAPLTQAQAKAAADILEPLRKKKTLEEPDARKALIALQAVLTDEQRASISALPPEPRFREGGPPPGRRPSGAPPGPPPGAGPGPTQDFNPLNPPQSRPPQQGGGV